MKGYVIFKVTTANGAVPIDNALVEISIEKNSFIKRTSKSGFSERFEISFDEDEDCCICATAKISSPGYEDCFVDDLKIYKNVTLVRIANLTEI